MMMERVQRAGEHSGALLLLRGRNGFMSKKSPSEDIRRADAPDMPREGDMSQSSRKMAAVKVMVLGP